MGEIRSLREARSLQRAGHSEEEAHPEQLDLFSRPARVLSLSSRLSSFQEALLLDMRGSDRAREGYLRAIEEGDSVADACCNLGIMAFDEKDASSALHYFTSALAAEPGHVETHFNLANVLMDLSQHAAAAVHFELAVALEPAFTAALYNLALARAAAEDYAGALEALERYLRETPEKRDGEAEALMDVLRQFLGRAADG